MVRSARTPPSATLRLADLKQRQPYASKSMSVKLPGALFAAIARLAEQLGASKTEAVIMLLNEGLDRERAGQR